MQLTRAELVYLRSLSAADKGREAPHFLLEGWRALGEMLRAGVAPEYVVLDPDRPGPPEAGAARAELAARGTPLKAATDRQMQRLAPTEHSPGVVALVRKARYGLDDVLPAGPALAVALDEVADPGNLGAVLRTCEWFGASGVLLGRGCAALHNDKAVRATAGALFHLPILERVPLAETLLQARDRGFRVVVATGDGGLPLPELAPRPRDLVVLGSEARGVSPALRGAADVVASVPRFGRVESLNVAVACGIVLACLRWPQGGPRSRR